MQLKKQTVGDHNQPLLFVLPIPNIYTGGVGRPQQSFIMYNPFLCTVYPFGYYPYDPTATDPTPPPPKDQPSSTFQENQKPLLSHPQPHLDHFLVPPQPRPRSKKDQDANWSEESSYIEEKRRYSERRKNLPKKFICGQENCSKRYSSQTALNNHLRGKHNLFKKGQRVRMQ